MTKQEWDKCFIWIMAVFPQWKVESATSAAWFDEIGMMERPQFVEAVKSLMSKNPSPFPPGVFEIKAESSPKMKSLHPCPEEAWGIALSTADEHYSAVWTDEIAIASGAAHEQLKAGDAVGGRMAFLEKYRTLIEIANRENRPPKWRASLGFNKDGREEAQAKADQLNEEVKLALLSPERKLLK